MKLKFFASFFSVLFFLSCANAPKDKPSQNTSEPDPKNKTLPKNKPASTFTDTLKINSSCAVFYYPDSLQLEKIKSLTDAKVYEGAMHEYFFLMRNAHLVIKKIMPKLNIIEAKNVRYLLFTGGKISKDCIDLDTKYDPYGLYIFNRKDAPQPVDMANIETALGFYFSN